MEKVGVQSLSFLKCFINFSVVMILFQIHGIGYNPCTILKFNAFKSQGLQSL